MDERAHVQRDPRSRNRDQRPRVEHLRAVVRHFGGFLVVQLGNEARVRNHSRIGGEDAGNVFPQHHAAGAEHSREQRGGEVRAAAAEGGDAVIRRAADEAGHDGNHALLEQRLEDAIGQQRRVPALRGGAAMGIVGTDDVEGIDEQRRAACAGNRRRDDRGGELLASRDQGVARPRRQVPQDAERFAQVPVLLYGRVDRRQRVAQRLASAEHRLRRGMVAVAQGPRDAGRFVIAAFDRVLGAVEQQIGDAAECRGHDDQRAVVGGNPSGRARDRLPVGQRRAAELPHFQTLLLSSRHHGDLLVLVLSLES